MNEKGIIRNIGLLGEINYIRKCVAQCELCLHEAKRKFGTESKVYEFYFTRLENLMKLLEEGD